MLSKGWRHCDGSIYTWGPFGGIIRTGLFWMVDGTFFLRYPDVTAALLFSQYIEYLMSHDFNGLHVHFVNYCLAVSQPRSWPGLV